MAAFVINSYTGSQGHNLYLLLVLQWLIAQNTATFGFAGQFLKSFHLDACSFCCSLNALILKLSIFPSFFFFFHGVSYPSHVDPYCCTVITNRPGLTFLPWPATCCYTGRVSSAYSTVRVIVKPWALNAPWVAAAKKSTLRTCTTMCIGYFCARHILGSYLTRTLACLLLTVKHHKLLKYVGIIFSLISTGSNGMAFLPWQS